MSQHAAGYEVVDERYDGYEHDNIDIELTPVPSARAPSCVSNKSSFYDCTDDDRRPLTSHAHELSTSDAPEGDQANFYSTQGINQTSTNRERRKKWSGWHFGVRLSALTATAVLILNIFMTVIAAAKYGTHDGVGTAYEGSCDVVNSLTRWLHILINALSSILLSASNYTMQALSAPTRRDIDRAHAKGDWCDIGVASVRNLSRIRWQRVVLWGMLALSSVPIHLLYNSAVFKTIDTNQYMAIVANPAWLEGADYVTPIRWYDRPVASNYTGNPYTLTVSEIPEYASSSRIVQRLFSEHAAYRNSTLFANLSNTDCMSIYGTSFISGHNHVVAVTKENGTLVNETMFYYHGADGNPIYDWMCAEGYYNRYNAGRHTCNPKALRTTNATDWRLNGKKIEYCLSQNMPQHCTMQFSIQILFAVIVCNAVKSAAMLVTLYRKEDPTLVTIGDAIASYLDTPDELTRGRCLMSRSDSSKWEVQLATGLCKPNRKILPKIYQKNESRRRWFRAAGLRRWFTTLGLISIVIISSGALLGLGVKNLENYSGLGPFNTGLGSIDSRALIQISLPTSVGGGLVASVLLANCPQAIVSFLYLLYNSLVTSLLLAKEWASYATNRKPLRVTTPLGKQRSTYYLQLPLRYGGPLLVVSAFLHWTISQAIFLARVNTFENGVRAEDASISQVGYSCPPILVAITIGVLLSLVAIGLGFRRFNSQMPVASSCSVAIAAACHRPKDDVDAAYLPVMWGELPSTKDDEVGHCCFTSQQVEPLTPGKMYAG